MRLLVGIISGVCSFADAQKGQVTLRHTMLAALIAQLVQDARSGLAVLRDWRCAPLDELALQLTTRNILIEADVNLVAALVCGTDDQSLLTEPALQAFVQQAVLLLDPAWKTVRVSGA